VYWYTGVMVYQCQCERIQCGCAKMIGIALLAYFYTNSFKTTHLLTGTLTLLHLYTSTLSKHHLPVRIQTDEYEQKHGEGDQGRTAVAQEWKRYSNHRDKTNGHANINGYMEK